jgi:ribonuclease BN (tRNA processing enzyme)
LLDRLLILGSGGWFAASGRHTACALARGGEAALLIDAGTGVVRLVERPELLDGVARLDILLTHFHLDHVIGLAYLAAIGLSCEVAVWGPGRTLYGTPTRDVLDTVTHYPFHPVPLESLDIDVRDLPAGEVEIAGVPLETRRQDRHSAPTLGFRFGDELGWITDTAHDPGSAPFVAGCRGLAHEAWFTSHAPRNADIHSSAAQAAVVAEQAGIERLLLIHLPPFGRDLAPLAVEAQTTMAEAVLAEDGQDASALLG